MVRRAGRQTTLLRPIDRDDALRDREEELGFLLDPQHPNTRISLQTRDEICLDGKDNILLGPRTRAFGRPDVWPHHLRHYWEGIITELDHEFRRCAPVAPYCRPPEFSPHINLRTTETGNSGIPTPQPSSLN